MIIFGLIVVAFDKADEAREVADIKKDLKDII